MASGQSRCWCGAHRPADRACCLNLRPTSTFVLKGKPAASVPTKIDPTMELTVSVVSYRTPELLRQCLAALEREALELEVFVVDNASGDGSVDMVRAEFPSANVIENTRNVGFGAAHNQALRRAHGRYWVVLNSDAVPQPGALDTLKRELDDDPEIAVVGPKLTFPDGTVQQSRRRFPKMNTLFAESTQLQRFWPDNAALRRYYVQDRSDDELQDVDWL